MNGESMVSVAKQKGPDRQRGKVLRVVLSLLNVSKQSDDIGNNVWDWWTMVGPSWYACVDISTRACSFYRSFRLRPHRLYPHDRRVQHDIVVFWCICSHVLCIAARRCADLRLFILHEAFARRRRAGFRMLFCMWNTPMRVPFETSARL